MPVTITTSTQTNAKVAFPKCAQQTWVKQCLNHFWSQSDNYNILIIIVNLPGLTPYGKVSQMLFVPDMVNTGYKSTCLLFKLPQKATIAVLISGHL